MVIGTWIQNWLVLLIQMITNHLVMSVIYQTHAFSFLCLSNIIDFIYRWEFIKKCNNTWITSMIIDWYIITSEVGANSQIRLVDFVIIFRCVWLNAEHSDSPLRPSQLLAAQKHHGTGNFSNTIKIGQQILRHICKYYKIG